tara:strand:+ start:203 stop:487 length:285 start_codon:yes stop_codon:yes gene_type:complete
MSSFTNIISHTKKESSCALNAALMGIIINLILPEIAVRFATPEEIKPKCVKSLSFKGQMMHMLVHHQQVKLTSSIIIFAIVYLSVLLGYSFKIF